MDVNTVRIGDFHSPFGPAPIYLQRKYDPLPWQVAGRCQTASGYGGKLSTCYTVFYMGRRRRVYCMCYSNCGTEYIVVKGQRVILHQAG